MCGSLYKLFAFLCLHPAPSFWFHKTCWDECVLHEQHWMYFSHCEYILIQPKSTGEVIAASSQLAFRALSGHIVFLSLGSYSIYIHTYIYVAVRHCNVTAFKCSWTITTFQPEDRPRGTNGLSVTEM